MVFIVTVISYSGCLAQYLEEVSSTEIFSTANSIYVQDGIVYIAGYDTLLQIIEVTDPSVPEPVGFYDTTGSADHVFVNSGLAFVPNWSAGLLIYDISDSYNPILLGSYNTPHVEHDVVANKNFAYLAICNYLKILDISNPAYPTLMGELHLDNAPDCRSIIKKGPYVLMSNLAGSVFIINVTNPLYPFLAAEYMANGLTWEVFVNGDYCYIACDRNGLEIIDISNPENPQYVTSIEVPGRADRVHCANNYAYVRSQSGGLYIYDISHPYNPVFITDYDYYFSRDLFAIGDYIYLVNSHHLIILRFTPTGIEPVGQLPASFYLSPNYPNPFNARTTIRYSLPDASPVTLDIYDLLGRKVQTLYNGPQPPGEHSLIWNADGFASGVYFYRLTAGEYEKTEKMTVIK